MVQLPSSEPELAMVTVCPVVNMCGEAVVAFTRCCVPPDTWIGVGGVAEVAIGYTSAVTKVNVLSPVTEIE
jgi:hypothetical protein